MMIHVFALKIKQLCIYPRVGQFEMNIIKLWVIGEGKSIWEIMEVIVGKSPCDVVNNDERYVCVVSSYIRGIYVRIHLKIYTYTSGVATRLCDENGEWELPNLINCTNEALANASLLVSYLT